MQIGLDSIQGVTYWWWWNCSLSMLPSKIGNEGLPFQPTATAKIIHQWITSSVVLQSYTTKQAKWKINWLYAHNCSNKIRILTKVSMIVFNHSHTSVTLLCKNLLTMREWETSCKMQGVTLPQKSRRMLIVSTWASLLGKLVLAICSKYTVQS